jgi:hypothetical protein
LSVRPFFRFCAGIAQRWPLRSLAILALPGAGWRDRVEAAGS